MSDRENAGATPDDENEQHQNQQGSEGTQSGNGEDQLGDAGKEALKREREARKTAEQELAKLRKAAEDERTAKAQADLEAKGEFEQVKAALIKERDDLKVRAETAEAELQSFVDREKAAIAKALKDLPNDLTEFFPGDDASLESQRKWLETATAQAAKRKAEPAKGNGANPERANGNGKVADEKNELARTGRYVM